MSLRESLRAISDRIDEVEDALGSLDFVGVAETLREELAVCRVCELRLRECDISHGETSKDDVDACLACVEDLGLANCRLCKQLILANEEDEHAADCELWCENCARFPAVDSVTCACEACGGDPKRDVRS